MSREDVIAVASRLFSLFLFISAVRIIGTALQTQHEVDFVQGLIYSTLPVVLVYVAVAAFLWYFPLTVARKLLPVMKDTGSPISSAGSDVAAIAFSVLGLWVLAYAISDGVYWVVFVSAVTDTGGHLPLTIQQKSRIVSLLVQALLGLCLVFGSRGISALLRNLRSR